MSTPAECWEGDGKDTPHRSIPTDDRADHKRFNQNPQTLTGFEYSHLRIDTI